MSEHRRDTEFLRSLIAFEETEQRRKLEARITQVLNDEQCVRHKAWLMALFTALGGVAFAYGVLLQENLPPGKSWFVIKLIGELDLAALISLVAFVSLLVRYRLKLK
jgi:hypothetical protein